MYFQMYRYFLVLACLYMSVCWCGSSLARVAQIYIYLNIKYQKDCMLRWELILYIVMAVSHLFWYMCINNSFKVKYKNKRMIKFAANIASQIPRQIFSCRYTVRKLQSSPAYCYSNELNIAKVITSIIVLLFRHKYNIFTAEINWFF